MNCDEIFDIYIKSLCAQLSSEESSSLEKHLLECTQCRNSLQWDKAIVTAIQNAVPAVPPPNLAAQVYSEIIRLEAERYNSMRFKIFFYAGAVFIGLLIAVPVFKLWNGIQLSYGEIIVHYTENILQKLQDFFNTMNHQITFSGNYSELLSNSFIRIYLMTVLGSVVLIISSMFSAVYILQKK